MHFENFDFWTLYNPLMTFNNIAYVLSWLECHTYTFSQVWAQLEHIENFNFWTPLWPLNDQRLSGPLRVVESGWPTDDKVDACAHDSKCQFNHPRFVRCANWKLHNSNRWRHTELKIVSSKLVGLTQMFWWKSRIVAIFLLFLILLHVLI